MKRLDEKRESPKSVAEAQGQQGFTLLEIVIALVLMMIVTLGVASVFAYAINYNSGANDRTLAQAVAQQQMEYLRRTPFDQLVTPEQRESVIVSGGRKYRVVTTVCADATAACGGSATLKKISIDVTPQGAGPNWVHSSVHIESLRASLVTGTYF